MESSAVDPTIRTLIEGRKVGNFQGGRNLKVGLIANDE